MRKKWERIAEINNILRAHLEKAKAENRDFAAEEKAEMDTLRREKSFLLVEMESADIHREAPAPAANPLVDFVREASKNRTATSIVLREEGAAPAGDQAHFTGDLGPIQPVHVGEIIEAVEEKLIWTLLGIQMPTGLGGQYEWPVVGDVEATFAGEGVTIDPVKVDISKVSAVQQRVAISMAMTRESIFNSEGRIRDIVLRKEPHAIAKAINNVVLSPTKVAGQELEGPFVNATAKTATFDFKGLNGVKAFLLGKGYENDSLVWVMDEATKAELEATPKDAGSGIMVIEDGKLCGRPVFTTSVMNGKIGLGDFRYQVVGQFGSPEMIVDPYSKARAGKVEITLNANFGTATLAKDAFVLVTRKA